MNLFSPNVFIFLSYAVKLVELTEKSSTVATKASTKRKRKKTIQTFNVLTSNSFCFFRRFFLFRFFLFFTKKNANSNYSMFRINLNTYSITNEKNINVLYCQHAITIHIFPFSFISLSFLLSLFSDLMSIHDHACVVHKFLLKLILCGIFCAVCIKITTPTPSRKKERKTRKKKIIV